MIVNHITERTEIDWSKPFNHMKNHGLQEMTMMMSDSNSNVKVIIHMHETLRHNSHAITGMSLPVLIETLKMYLLQRN